MVSATVPDIVERTRERTEPRFNPFHPLWLFAEVIGSWTGFVVFAFMIGASGARACGTCRHGRGWPRCAVL